LTYDQSLGPQATAMVQTRLRELGFYRGPIDGVWGFDSQAALQSFQQARGLQVTGALNEATVAMLNLRDSDVLAAAPGAVPSQPEPPMVVAGDSLSPGAVLAVQRRLRALGFYQGRVDGVWGAGTQAAIESFQQGRGLQPNGQLNPATVAALNLDPNILITQASR
jgi:peptidoglycan hydrolase-like protein with peptidoglycan-binding domain